MTRLFMVTHYFDSHGGGIEVVARNLFQGLAQREYEIKWAAADVSPAPANEEQQCALPLRTWNGVEAILGVPFPVPSPGAIFNLGKAVAAADVVLLHDCLYLGNIIAFLFARLRKKPVVIVQHIGTVPYSAPALRVLMKLANVMLTRPMLASADQVVFISEITRRFFSSVKFKRPSVLIYNGVDCGRFSTVASKEEKRILRAKFNLPAEGPIALFVGRFVEKKGLRILREMALRAPEISWAFAGKGPLDPRQWGSENVHVYSDLWGAAISELYRASDLLVLPSTGEGLPLVMQEALASGLPVVCSAETVSADDMLTRFVRGVPLVPGDDAGSSERFLSATRELLEKPWSEDCAQERSAFVRERYSWRRACEQYRALISVVTSKHRVAPAAAITTSARIDTSCRESEGDQCRQ